MTDPIEAAAEAFLRSNQDCYGTADVAATLPAMRAAIAAYHDAEIEALRAQVAELETDLDRERMRLAACSTAALGYFEEPCKDEYRSAALVDVLRLYNQLADCRAVLRERGHEIWCGSNNCGHLYAGGFCGIGRDGHGPNGAAHEFVARHGCTCGYARVMGEG